MIKSALRLRTTRLTCERIVRKKRRGFVQEIGTICSRHVDNTWNIHATGTDECSRRSWSTSTAVAAFLSKKPPSRSNAIWRKLVLMVVERTPFSLWLFFPLVLSTSSISLPSLSPRRLRRAVAPWGPRIPRRCSLFIVRLRKNVEDPQLNNRV